MITASFLPAWHQKLIHSNNEDVVFLGDSIYIQNWLHFLLQFDIIEIYNLVL